ncbi:MAG: transglutaminase domain-containing protein [Nostocales cyanobacterium]|nr:MAG: transglutaminase domain-containing protein [Nostocales cyanobacterium]TAF21459.1 MAG: transglutaminase domain-containing protein [Nostocales cyanobacterium]
MKTPPLLIATALIFWGWQTGLWIFAIPIAIILESSRFVQSRWDFSIEDIKKIANLCVVILVALTVYLLVSTKSFYVIYTLLQWLPIISLPLIATQIYGVNDSISLTTLFFTFHDPETGEQSHKFKLNLTYPYIAVCILAASNANTENISFYIGLFILTALILWNFRSRRFSPAIWLCLLLTAGSVGFVGQMGLHQLHLQLENQVVAWFSDIIGQEINTVNKQTSIGEIGVLKQSNNIVFRVNLPTKSNFPILLQEATYNKYQSGSWVAVNSQFQPIKPTDDGKNWILGNSQPNHSQITINGTLNNGKGVLRLANGTFAINDLPVTEMQKNQYGTVQVLSKVNDIDYTIKFNPQFPLESPPTQADLQIPPSELPAINEIIRQLNIKTQTQTTPEILKTLNSFLFNNYQYSLQIKDSKSKITPLSTFLLDTRSGHCEYFATASTLIFRALGIPARYTVGYSVHEFSNLEQQYIVRSRHAHAWTMVYINGKWQTFDSTPPDWTNIENAQISQFSKLGDLWSFIGFKTSEFFTYLRNTGLINYLWWLLLPIFMIMLRKSAPSNAVKRVFKQQKILNNSEKSTNLKTDSDIYLIEQALNDIGFNRYPGESLKNWISRIKKELSENDDYKYKIDELSSLIELHYRYRFDPQGIKHSEREKLQSAVKLWLDKYSI